MKKKDLYLLAIPAGLLVIFLLMKNKTISTTPTVGQDVRSQSLNSLIGAGAGLISNFINTAAGFFTSSAPASAGIDLAPSFQTSVESGGSMFAASDLIGFFDTPSVEMVWL